METRERIESVRRKVAAACRQAGRPAESVTVVAVTKTFGADVVDAVVAGGIVDIGENRVQELETKMEAVEARCRWHLIGPLQRNKVRRVVGRCHLIHSVDSIRIAEAISRVSAEREARTRVLVQVNLTGEATKHGFAPEDALDALARVASLPSVDLRGLMTIGPLSGGEDAARGCFRRLRELRELAATRGIAGVDELSMGMSGDYVAAIEEGATIVRVGSAITGARGTPAGRVDRR